MYVFQTSVCVVQRNFKKKTCLKYQKTTKRGKKGLTMLPSTPLFRKKNFRNCSSPFERVVFAHLWLHGVYCCRGRLPILKVFGVSGQRRVSIRETRPRSLNSTLRICDAPAANPRLHAQNCLKFNKTNDPTLLKCPTKRVKFGPINPNRWWWISWIYISKKH